MSLRRLLIGLLAMVAGAATYGVSLAEGPEPPKVVGRPSPPSASSTPIPPQPSGVIDTTTTGGASIAFRRSASSGAPPLGTNVRMNQDGSGRPQNESSIAINPIDLNNIVVGANDYRQGDARSGFYSSLDGGSTWTDGILPNYPAGVHSHGDPALAFDSDGNVYYAGLGFPDSGVRCQPEGAIYLSKSADGGVTWGPALLVAANALGPPLFLLTDKEYIATDRSGGPFDGRIYVSLTVFQFDQACGDGYVASPIYLATVQPGGSAVQSLVELGGGLQDRTSQGSVPAVDSHGNVYVVYQTEDETCPATMTQLDGEESVAQQRAVHIAASADGGASFGAPGRVVCQHSLPFSNNLNREILPPTVFRVNSYPTMAVNPANDDIYVAWTEWRPQTDADIMLVRSTDGGASWGDPVRVNNDPAGNGRDQFFPWLSVSPDGRRVDVVFYDRRDAADNTRFHTYVSSSLDGGRSFTVNRRVTSLASDPAVDGFGGTFIGDYNGIASTNDALHPVWTGTTNGEADVFYARVVAPPSEPAPLPSLAPWALATSATPLALLLTASVRKRLAA